MFLLIRINVTYMYIFPFYICLNTVALVKQFSDPRN